MSARIPTYMWQLSPLLRPIEKSVGPLRCGRTPSLWGTADGSSGEPFRGTPQSSTLKVSTKERGLFPNGVLLAAAGDRAEWGESERVIPGMGAYRDGPLRTETAGVNVLSHLGALPELGRESGSLVSFFTKSYSISFAALQERKRPPRALPTTGFYVSLTMEVLG